MNVAHTDGRRLKRGVDEAGIRIKIDAQLRAGRPTTWRASPTSLSRISNPRGWAGSATDDENELLRFEELHRGQRGNPASKEPTSGQRSARTASPACGVWIPVKDADMRALTARLALLSQARKTVGCPSLIPLVTKQFEC